MERVEMGMGREHLLQLERGKVTMLERRRGDIRSSIITRKCAARRATHGVVDLDLDLDLGLVVDLHLHLVLHLTLALLIDLIEGLLIRGKGRVGVVG